MDLHVLSTSAEIPRATSTIDERVYFANLGYDLELVQKMNQFYLKYLYQMKEALEEVNRRGVTEDAKHLLHKLKATYGIFGMKREFQLIEELEASIAHLPYIEKIKKMDQIMTAIGRLIYDLENMALQSSH